ncbi:hypothetical protein EIP91_004043 [Steccherinum ochraceum]|uniref:HIT domain-containing protein n=1 Tax=Steccherinum ochraceum TaxID=92696 RepID=A0A4R0RAR7_9APHY|nr:hypothetical protein EIP91_004043 [Steccherinum ochraceum]
MHSVQHVGKVIERAYHASGLTIACQDGPAAGQTVPHVHFHLLPRKLAGDPFEGHNDRVYPALEHAEETLPSHLLGIEPKGRSDNGKAEPIKVDADDDRKPRSLEDMEKEASWLKELFNNDEVGSTR